MPTCGLRRVRWLRESTLVYTVDLVSPPAFRRPRVEFLLARTRRNQKCALSGPGGLLGLPYRRPGRLATPLYKSWQHRPEVTPPMDPESTHTHHSCSTRPNPALLHCPAVSDGSRPLEDDGGLLGRRNTRAAFVSAMSRGEAADISRGR